MTRAHDLAPLEVEVAINSQRARVTGALSRAGWTTIVETASRLQPLIGRRWGCRCNDNCLQALLEEAHDLLAPDVRLLHPLQTHLIEEAQPATQPEHDE